MTIKQIASHSLAMFVGLLLMGLALAMISTPGIDHPTQWFLVLGFFSGGLMFFASLWSLLTAYDIL